MSTLEAALRGGAIAVLLLTIGLRARDLLTSRLSRYSALLKLCAAAFVVDSAPGVGALDLDLRIPIHVVSSSTPAVFWIMAAALFDDEFSPRWYHGLAWLGLAALAWWEMFDGAPAVASSYNAMALLFVLLGIWHALAGRAIDLVEWRRRLRVEFAICVALYIALIIASEWLRPGILGVAPFSLINAIVLVGLFFLFSLRLNKDRNAPDAVPERLDISAAVDARPVPPATGPDAALLDALRQQMEVDKAYRDDTLSIASLSERLGAQEYRLRRLINGQLGHRNFSAFVNGYRLKEAAAALADPGQAEVPILTIALDSGFGSIGPFNRAFKAHTGLTPTEYRRARLGGAEDMSPIPESASRS